MQANPEKFQAISVGKKTHDKNVMFNLNGINLSCEDEVKLLGVTIIHRTVFFTEKNRSFIKILNKIGPSIEP
jgi:hypothetical protein